MTVWTPTSGRVVVVVALLGLLCSPSPAVARPLAGTAGPSSLTATPSGTAPPSPGDAGTTGAIELPADAVGMHRWPVAGAVVAPWVAPASPYGPGHRGVDLAVASGDPVRAMAAGAVGFAGVVAGRAWVSIDHPGGLRTTFGPLATIAVTAGDRVGQSAIVGTAAATAHADASTSRTGRLHVSARVHGTYVDPTPLVGRLVATLLPEP